nr:M14 metal carboxypeptidase 4 [Antheraea yamamai]
MHKLISISILLIACASGEKFRFDNYTLYKVLPANSDHIKTLQNLYESDERYDFWSDPVPNAEYVSVLSAPQDRIYLENLLERNAVPFTVSLDDIQKAIDKQVIKKYERNNIRSMQWDAYYPLEDINAWIDDLVRAYPGIVTSEIGGTSYEGREIKGFKISHGEGKKVIFIESGIHAREWITPATVCYIATELLTSYDEETKAAAREFDWYIFPVTNPDGYIWTFTDFRLWRKNRRPVGSDYGIDLNRNWNNNWLVLGASTNSASDNYAGPGPFSEAESRTLSTYISAMSHRIEMYLSFHSSGQLLLLPFGNTTEPLANYYDAMNIGRRAMGALSVRYGTEYTTGNIAEAIYHATGTSVDWVKEHLQVPLVYCYELRDRGTYGHLLPPEQILPTSQETMDSVIDLIHQAKRFGYLNDLHNNDLRYDFWTSPRPLTGFVNLMSSPEHRNDFENLLNKNGIKYTISMPNVQEAIEKERFKTYTRGDVRSMQFDAYYTLEQINAWIDDLARTYPDIVTVQIAGRSYEGHDIKGLKISHGSGRKIIFLEGGIHSREWISPATVNFITNELLTSDDEEIRAAARDYDWYIFPVTNPDGYIWSHTQFRMWRKNRRPFGSNFGVDLNRNWNSNWLVAGASTNPASDTYAGPGPFSEPESRSLSEYIRTIHDRIDLYLSFHSFGHLLLIPFGNSTAAYSNYYDAINIGRRAMGALSVRYGTLYTTGNIAEAIYHATGGSIDWVKGHLNVPLVYCYESRDQGEYGFLLPEDQILPNSLETMDSVLEMIHQAKRFGYMNANSGLKASILVLAMGVMALKSFY